MKRKWLSVILLGILFSTGCNNADNATALSTAISQIDMDANGHIEQLHDYDSPERFCQGIMSNFLKKIYVHCSKGIGMVQQYGN